MAVAVHLKLLVPHAKKGNRGGPESICKRKEVAGTAHSTAVTLGSLLTPPH